MADEEREEDLTDLIAAMASDHMMSFGAEGLDSF